MCVVPPPHLILQNLNSAVASLAQLVSPSVALPAQLVTTFNELKVNRATKVAADSV